MSGPQFQGQPSQGIPRGSIPQNVPQGFQPRQGSPSTSDGSQSLGESRSTTQPPSQQQTPQHQNDPYEARSVGRAPFHGQPSQPYTSSSFPQIPQQQMQGTGSSLPQRQWRHQGHPGKNFVRTPQQQMQPPVHQAGPPSESASATSEEDSDDDDSSESDDDEDEEGEEDNEDGFPTTGNHPGWPQQSLRRLDIYRETISASRTDSPKGIPIDRQRFVWSYWLNCRPVGETRESTVYSLVNCGNHTLRCYFEATSS
ncbi:hypothetical protein KC320_g453 [Hortaea werneckii]|nr:hypothetical protein KC320_g453 [Hortaea werneckii]